MEKKGNKRDQTKEARSAGIKTLIEERGLKGRYLLEKYGIPEVTFYQWKGNKTAPPEYLILLLSRIEKEDLKVEDTEDLAEFIKNTGITRELISKNYGIPRPTVVAWTKAENRVEPPVYIRKMLVTVIKADMSKEKTEEEELTMKMLLDRHGMTVDEVAKRYEIPLKTVSNWVYDKSSHPARYLLKLLDRVMAEDKKK